MLNSNLSNPFDPFFPWFFMGFSWLSHGFPMGFPWQTPMAWDGAVDVPTNTWRSRSPADPTPKLRPPSDRTGRGCGGSSRNRRTPGTRF